MGDVRSDVVFSKKFSTGIWTLVRDDKRSFSSHQVQNIRKLGNWFDVWCEKLSFQWEKYEN